MCSVSEEETGVKTDRQCVYSFDQRMTNFSNWLLQIMAMGDFEAFFPAATHEYAPTVADVWNDPALRETYKRRNELHSLPDVAKYFIDRVLIVTFLCIIYIYVQEQNFDISLY